MISVGDTAYPMTICAISRFQPATGTEVWIEQIPELAFDCNGIVLQSKAVTIGDDVYPTLTCVISSAQPGNGEQVWIEE